jgi:hypothetical protein
VGLGRLRAGFSLAAETAGVENSAMARQVPVEGVTGVHDPGAWYVYLTPVVAVGLICFLGLREK